MCEHIHMLLPIVSISYKEEKYSLYPVPALWWHIRCGWLQQIPSVTIRDDLSCETHVQNTVSFGQQNSEVNVQKHERLYQTSERSMTMVWPVLNYAITA